MNAALCEKGPCAEIYTFFLLRKQRERTQQAERGRKVFNKHAGRMSIGAQIFWAVSC